MLHIDTKKLGKIDAIYFDNETDAPEWALVVLGVLAIGAGIVTTRENRAATTA